MLAMLLALTLQAQPPRAPQVKMTWPVTAIVLGQGADVVSTCQAMSRGFHESNVLMGGRHANCTSTIIAKSALTTLWIATVYAANNKGKGKEARVIAYVVAGIGAAAAAWNWRVLAKGHR